MQKYPEVTDTNTPDQRYPSSKLNFLLQAYQEYAIPLPKMDSNTDLKRAKSITRNN